MDNNERILGINEIRELYAVNDLQESDLEQQIDEAERNMQISSMDINMCRIIEKENLFSVPVTGLDEEFIERVAEQTVEIHNAELKESRELKILYKQLEETKKKYL